MDVDPFEAKSGLQMNAFRILVCCIGHTSAANVHCEHVEDMTVTL